MKLKRNASLGLLYLLPVLFPLIGFIGVEKSDDEHRYHTVQAMVTHILQIALGIVLAIIRGIIYAIAANTYRYVYNPSYLSLLGVGNAIYSITYIISAGVLTLAILGFCGKVFRLPVISKIADYFYEKIYKVKNPATPVQAATPTPAGQPSYTAPPAGAPVPQQPYSAPLPVQQPMQSQPPVQQSAPPQPLAQSTPEQAAPQQDAPSNDSPKQP